MLALECKGIFDANNRNNGFEQRDDSGKLVGMRLGPFALFVCAGVASLAAPVTPGTPFRFVAKQDSLVHVSLRRGYDQMPGNLEIVEVGEGTATEERSYTPENTQTHPGVFAFRSVLVRKGHAYEARVTQPGELDVQFFPQGSDPVEKGTSWLIRAADAWLSNQPRHG